MGTTLVSRALSPVAWLALATGVVIAGAAGRADGPLGEYRTRALITVLALVAGAAWWRGQAQGREWCLEAVPAAAGATAALALATALDGTPFAPGGLGGDQTFRTAAVTRFADSWHNADFTVAGLPSYYPPSYFWVLGRVADVAGVEPWRMLKYGAIATALVVPMVAHLMWRRIVAPHLAALIAVVPVVVENFYEPYAWLTLTAFVPWWIESVHGVRRAPVRARHLVQLGLIGALLFTTYYYFFGVGVVLAVVFVIGERLGGRSIASVEVRRTATVFGIAAVMSAVFWVPLVVSVVTAPHPEVLSSRWFSAHHGTLPLPFLEPSPAGLVMLIGLAHTVWRAGRDALARALLTMLAGVYCWYLLGAGAALLDHPLLSFRAKPLVPMVLLPAGLLAVVRGVEFAGTRAARADVRRVALALGLAGGLHVGHVFLTNVRTSSYIDAARNASAPSASAAALESVLALQVGAHGVLVSDRVDVLAYFPHHAFVPWNAHYAHPAAEFGQRIEVLTDLAATADPDEFAALATRTEFGPIDAFVLRVDGEQWVFQYTADAFPNGARPAEVRFEREQFGRFAITTVDDHVVAVLPRAEAGPGDGRFARAGGG